MFCSLSVLEKKRDNFPWTEMQRFQDKGSIPMMITFGYFLLKTQVL